MRVWGLTEAKNPDAKRNLNPPTPFDKEGKGDFFFPNPLPNSGGEGRVRGCSHQYKYATLKMDYGIERVPPARSRTKSIAV